MSDRPWMPLYVADYLADTGHLSAAEHGAYMLLIMHYWQNGELPQEERRLARIARLSEGEWSTSRDVLADLFSEGWTHKRIEAEIERATDISSKRKAAALQRHSKRDAIAPANAELMQTQSQSHTQEEKREANASLKKRGTRIPNEFVPDLAWAESNGLPKQQAEVEAAKFRDYWSSKGGNATKTDWPATWRNWVRTALERLPQARGSPRVDPVTEVANRLMAKMDAANADPAAEIESDHPAPLRLFASG